MVDTARSVSDLQTLLADNTVGAISPQDLRDFLITSLGVYGSLSVFEGATSQTSLGTTAAKLTAFDTEGTAKGTSVSSTNDEITINVDGDYTVNFQCSFSGTANAEVSFRLRNNAVEESYGCVRKLGTSGDVGSCSFIACGIALVNTDVLTIYVETDDGGNGDQITVSDAQFHVSMSG